MFKKFARSLFFCAIAVLCACQSKEKKKEQKMNEANIQILKKDSAGEKLDNISQRPPIINVMDTFITRQNFIYIKDSSATSAGISKKFSILFDTKLSDFARKNNLQIVGNRTVWFKTLQSPFYFEAGLAVNKKPEKLSAPVQFKFSGGDSAVVAHYFGPYSNTVLAYDVLNEWLKDHHKKRKGDACEIYVDSPVDEKGKAKNPFKVGTDIIMPHN